MNKHLKIDGQRSASVDFGLLRSKFQEYGITRIADITGLDVIGVPVVTLCRPNSPTLSINSGKGLTMDSAIVSGTMEALEFAIAERWIDPSAVFAPHFSLGGDVIPLDLLGYSKNTIFRNDLSFRWEKMNQIGAGEVYAPSSQVGLVAQHEGYDELMAFQIGTNGIASGGCEEDALLSGIYEVIERDAWTIDWLRANMGWRSNLVDLTTIPDGQLKNLIGKIHEAGCEVFLIDVTLDTAPVFGAYITDKHEKGVGIFLGYGCHLDPEIAAIRAVTEACQGRACYIAGARDDLFRRNFAVLKKQVDAGEKLRAIKPNTDFLKHENEASDYVDKDMNTLVGMVHASGHAILEKTISTDSDPCVVKRVIIPGFEGHNFDYYSVGKRAAKHLEQK